MFAWLDEYLKPQGMLIVEPIDIVSVCSEMYVNVIGFLSDESIYW